MNLAIDIGNTACKWALYEGRTLVESGKWNKESEEWKVENVDTVLACVSGGNDLFESISKASTFHLSPLTSETPLPIQLDYRTPQTLGADRVAAACGAWGLHRGEPCLIVDAGTCITVDYLDANGVYHGGAIMPGLRMQLRALNEHTARLPLVDLDGVEKAHVAGRDTETSIVAGTLGATMLALAGFVTMYKEKNPALRVLLTGGDAEAFIRTGATGWEHVPMLTLGGLNEIMLYNEE